MRLILALLVALLPLSARAQTIDYSIADQSGASFLTDLNAHLGAIVRHNAGTTAPTTTFPYQVWVDTSGAIPVYRYRNAANSAWISAFQIDASAATWLAALNTSAATITGGTINGTTVGATTPASGAFTTIAATGDVGISNTTGPILRLTDSDATAGFAQTRLSRGGNFFVIQTATNGGTRVSDDYFIEHGSSGAVVHVFQVAGAERLRLNSTGLDVTGRIRITNGADIIPDDAVGTSDLGGTATANRWVNVYLRNAPNVSSDARLKRDIEAVAAAECRVADRIKVTRYRLNSEAGGPWHFGVIAQEVIAAFEAEGLEWRDYAIVTGSEADTYGVAYDELQNLKLACL